MHCRRQQASAGLHSTAHRPSTTQSTPAYATPTHLTSSHLDRRLVRDGRDALRLVVLRTDGPRLPRHRRLPLQVHGLARVLRLPLRRRVRFDTGKELVTGARLADVLDADVDALLDVAVADLSVEDDADGGFGDVVDDACLAVVDLVGLQRV